MHTKEERKWQNGWKERLEEMKQKTGNKIGMKNRLLKRINDQFRLRPGLEFVLIFFIIIDW